MKSFSERFSDIEIIDFHTHPFSMTENNICAYRHEFEMKPEESFDVMRSFGISRMCGSAIRLERLEEFKSPLEQFRADNREILKIRDMSDGFVIPGVHIHPDYVEESIEELVLMHSLGVRLVGELVPYLQSWERYDRDGLHAILDTAARLGMAVSFHNMAEDSIDEMVGRHPDVQFVAAHPGEYNSVVENAERMLKYGNLSLDISGTGVFRLHAVRYLVEKVGSDRILFGSDYPICNPGVYIGGLLAEPLRDGDFENIFSGNAKRILGI